jgi:hypothetical protein
MFHDGYVTLEEKYTPKARPKVIATKPVSSFGNGYV